MIEVSFATDEVIILNYVFWHVTHVSIYIPTFRSNLPPPIFTVKTNLHLFFSLTHSFLFIFSPILDFILILLSSFLTLSPVFGP
jgi:hypothetical protein